MTREPQPELETPETGKRLPHSAHSALFALVVLVAASAAPSAQADHGAQYSQADIAVGYTVYSSQCTQCHGAYGDGIAGIDLRKGVFRRATSDEDLAGVVTKGVPGVGMPPFALQAAELRGVIAFIRAGFDQTVSVRVGDASRGRALFDGKGGCTSCHRVQGHGALAAPDLSGVGLSRTLGALQRSLIDPSSAMLPINRPVRIALKSGETVTGRRLNEDTYTVQVIDAQARLRSIAKPDIRRMVVDTVSPMPSFASRLTDDELADVIGYLVTLREP
jgi:putative heme-binding domain-containing protein